MVDSHFEQNRWIDELRFHVLFNSISVISERWEGDNERLCAVETAFTIYLFHYQKADDKVFVCKFSKNVKSKLYHIENSKTRVQIV